MCVCRALVCSLERKVLFDKCVCILILKWSRDWHVWGCLVWKCLYSWEFGNVVVRSFWEKKVGCYLFVCGNVHFPLRLVFCMFSLVFLCLGVYSFTRLMWCHLGCCIGVAYGSCINGGQVEGVVCWFCVDDVVWDVVLVPLIFNYECEL